MVDNRLPPTFNEDNVEILKKSLEKMAALCEVAWVCADKFKELSNPGRLNYFLLMDDQVMVARTELDGLLMRFSE